MASNSTTPNPFKRFFEILQDERTDITAVYFYAVLISLVQLSLPLGVQSIISFVLGNAISTSLVILIIVVIIGVLVNGLLQINQLKIIERIQQQLFVRYAFQYAQVIPKLNLRYVDGYYLPELTNRFFDTVTLQKSISKILLDLPAATLQIVFGLLLLAFYHPVFIFFGILLVLVVYLMLVISGKRGFDTSVMESNFKYQVAAYLQDLARTVTSFKFSRNQRLHLNKTDAYVTSYLGSRTDHFRVLLFQFWVLVGFKVLITAAMLIVGALLLVDQQINVGQFVAAELVIMTVISSVEKIISSLDVVYDMMTSLEKVSKLTDKPTEETGKIKLNASAGISLRAEGLTFCYTEDSKPVLENVSFEVRPGQIFCLKGEFAAGKSTLLRMLTGAYQPFQGSLTINDLAISSYDLLSLRCATGVLLHQQEIFQGTLMENILMDEAKDAHLSELQHLAEIVGLKSFVQRHHEGYNMELHTDGQHLSGKVVKKVLLMRALIRKPRLLILEDPFTGIEPENVEKLKAYLLGEARNTTMVIVANDPEFERMADVVMELDEGHVLHYGKPSTSNP